MKTVLSILFLFAMTGSAAAYREPLRLPEQAAQGGLVVGWAPKGSRISVDGKAVPQSASGHFTFGLARDAKPTVVVSVVLPRGGAALERRIKVRQRRYNIQRIDGLPDKYVKPIDPSSALYKRLEREYLAIKAVRERMTDLPYYRQRFSWPAVGRISGVYGSQRILNGKPRRPHYGMDIAAATGTPVRAPAPGVVALAHPDMYFSGKTLILDHGMGVTTSYIHLSRIAVKVGQRVQRGQLIGRIGTTGRSTGPHLHWGMNWGLVYLDPRLRLIPLPKRKN